MAGRDVVLNEPASRLRTFGRSAEPYGIPWTIVVRANRVHARHLPVRVREQPGTLSADRVDAHRRTARIATRSWSIRTDRRGRRRARSLRRGTRTITRTDAHSRIGCDVESSLQRTTTGKLHLGRRRRVTDSARARELQRSRLGLNGPRHPLHRRVHAGVVPLARPSRSRTK